MQNSSKLAIPINLKKIQIATKKIDFTMMGFNMASEPKTGFLLRSLASTIDAGGKFLELGTGTGLSTTWILDGMEPNSLLVSIDNEEKFIAIAKEYLSFDRRVQFVTSDGAKFIESLNNQQSYDFVFADSIHGKYEYLDNILNRINPGGIYIIDDMVPQKDWPEFHILRLKQVVANLNERDDFEIFNLINYSSGMIIARKRGLDNNKIALWLRDNIDQQKGELSAEYQKLVNDL